MRKIITIATRESLLAIQQTNVVAHTLKSLYPELEIKILGITTVGDKRLDVALTEIGGKGLFVKELEEALLDGRADMAVHCVKDMPMEYPDGLSMPVICERADVRDVFVSNMATSYQDLPHHAVVGTASLRRQAQLLALRPDLSVQTLRGNVITRLRKLDAGEYDAIILAAAGLHRLGLAERIKSYFSVADSLPAAGQGALGIEMRTDDQDIRSLIAPLHHTDTASCVLAERAVCRRLNGGCKLPVAAFAELNVGELWLRALVANADGTQIIRAEKRGLAVDADQLGIAVADDLLQHGANAILALFQHDLS